jgi:IS5 family transposase
MLRIHFLQHWFGLSGPATEETRSQNASEKKSNQWHFGMKLHVDLDSKAGIIHSMAITPANVHDSQKLGELLHGEERRVRVIWRTHIKKR